MGAKKNTQHNRDSIVYFFTPSFTQQKHDFIVLFGGKNNTQQNRNSIVEQHDEIMILLCSMGVKKYMQQNHDSTAALHIIHNKSIFLWKEKF